MNTKLVELNDRYGDLRINLGSTLNSYTDDLYVNGQRFTGEAISADVVVDELKGKYEGQGPQNPPVPNP